MDNEQTEVQTVKLLESDLPKMVFAAPLSAHTTFTLRVNGPFGEREAKNLLRLLQVQVEMLSEDEQHG